MIETKDKLLVATEPCVEKLTLRDYLDTYLRQHNDMVATYDWMKPRLNGPQRQEWERTIRALHIVCHALDAGFDPSTPPKNWASGVLIQYMAPIPTHVREAIDRAEPIFGRDHLLVYDPNTEHFQRPKNTDPMVFGFTDLANQRLHFLVGQWDLAADLKFIEGSQKLETAGEAFNNFWTLIGNHPDRDGGVLHKVDPFIPKVYGPKRIDSVDGWDDVANRHRRIRSSFGSGLVYKASHGAQDNPFTSKWLNAMVPGK